MEGVAYTALTHVHHRLGLARRMFGQIAREEAEHRDDSLRRMTCARFDASPEASR